MNSFFSTTTSPEHRRLLCKSFIFRDHRNEKHTRATCKPQQKHILECSRCRLLTAAVSDKYVVCLRVGQVDNKGNHLLVHEESSINVPAIAAAHVIKRYTAQASDELSFEVTAVYVFPFVFIQRNM